MCMAAAVVAVPQEVAVEDMQMGGQLWTITKMASLGIQRKQNGPVRIFQMQLIRKANKSLIQEFIFVHKHFIGGEPAEVYWHSGAYHRGGYAYRLCRVHNQKYWKVTEECFQQGHLNFAGKENVKSWLKHIISYR